MNHKITNPKKLAVNVSEDFDGAENALPVEPKGNILRPLLTETEREI